MWCSSVDYSTLALSGVCVQPVTVINGSTLPQDLVCQLCDNQGNAACESDVKISLIRDSPHLKVRFRLRLCIFDTLFLYRNNFLFVDTCI